MREIRAIHTQRRQDAKARRPTQTRTYRLDVESVEAVGALAERLGVYPSDVVNLLLTRALAEVRAGRWPLGRAPIVYEPVWKDKGGE